MTDFVTHEKDDLLREHLLINHKLTDAETMYPGCIRILSTGRYHARIEVDGTGWEFKIVEVKLNEFKLLSRFPRDIYPSVLWELVWHRAAEAMLAHRKGHFEADRNKKLRKPQTEQDV